MILGSGRTAGAFCCSSMCVLLDLSGAARLLSRTLLMSSLARGRELNSSRMIGGSRNGMSSRDMRRQSVKNGLLAGSTDSNNCTVEVVNM